MTDKDQPQKTDATKPQKPALVPENMPEEIGGSGKAEPTRFGDWEVAGRCSDF